MGTLLSKQNQKRPPKTVTTHQKRAHIGGLKHQLETFDDLKTYADKENYYTIIITGDLNIENNC